MRKSFQYKATLSPAAAQRAAAQLALCCELYNAALQERRDAYRIAGVSLSAASQSAQLPALKQLRPELKAVGSQVLQDVLQRLDRAYQAFFRRVKAGTAPGFPRFKSVKRYDSLTFKQAGWKLATPNGMRRTLTLQGIGTCNLRWSRDLEGVVKTVTLKRDRCGDWFVTFSCDHVAEQPLPATGTSVGIDLGLEHFLTTSDGVHVANPRPLRAAEAQLKRTQRRVSKRTRGSHRRRKLVRTLARQHRKVERVRRDFHQKTALHLVRQYDVIAVEQLNVKGMQRSRLAKSVSDAGWGGFLQTLRFKAASAGREVVAVNPAGTSQRCSSCGAVVSKPLSVRVHACGCGYVAHRDVNAAKNVLQLALQHHAARAAPSASGRGCEHAA